MTPKHLEKLKADIEANIRNDKGEAPTVRINQNRMAVQVSAEDGRGFADFYGEFRGGYQWIHPALVNWAGAHKGHWEWENGGCICFYE